MVQKTTLINKLNQVDKEVPLWNSGLFRIWSLRDMIECNVCDIAKLIRDLKDNELVYYNISKQL